MALHLFTEPSNTDWVGDGQDANMLYLKVHDLATVPVSVVLTFTHNLQLAIFRV